MDCTVYKSPWIAITKKTRNGGFDVCSIARPLIYRWHSSGDDDRKGDDDGDGEGGSGGGGGKRWAAASGKAAMARAKVVKVKSSAAKGRVGQLFTFTGEALEETREH